MSTICRIFNLVQEIELCQNRPIIALKRSLFIFKYIYIYIYIWHQVDSGCQHQTGAPLLSLLFHRMSHRGNKHLRAIVVISSARLKQRFGPHGQGSRYCFPGQPCSGCWLIGIPGPRGFSPSIAIWLYPQRCFTTLKHGFSVQTTGSLCPILAKPVIIPLYIYIYPIIVTHLIHRAPLFHDFSWFNTVYVKLASGYSAMENGRIH